MTHNKNVVNITYFVVNDPLRGFSANVTFNSSVIISKMWVYVTIRVSMNENDIKFQRELIKTVVDLEKAFRGRQNNFLIGVLIDSFVKAGIDDLKFPMRKASNFSNFG